MAGQQVLRIRHELYQDPKSYLLASRVTVETTGTIGFKWFRLESPDRVVFDFSPAGVELPDGALPADDGLVKTVRWARQPGDTVRVVLDLARPAPFRARWLSGPPRLVIDVDRLEVTLYDHRRSTLLVLPFDDYLVGVLAAEMPAGFQVEALKAQAVAARTYALRKLRVFGGSGCAKNPGADLCSDPGHCQGYLGRDELRAAWKEDFDKNLARLAGAVAGTRELVLAFGGALADAVYHSTCGGHTASAAEVWGRPVPYLPGAPCEYCVISPHYRETRRLPLAELDRSLGSPLLAVESVTPSGRAERVVAGARALSGAEARQRFGLSSGLIEDIAGDVAITTRGWGHGVGLCQWGAEGQARLGRTFREILSYYYPGASVAGVPFSPPDGPEQPPVPGPSPGPRPGPAPSPGPLPVVVLDPGHGGSDPGATGPGGETEKDANLAIALVAAEFLDGRVDLSLTRRDDSTVSLRQRTDLANSKRAALFVSIHNNGSVDPRASGTETYHYPTSRLGASLATFIQKRLVAALRRPDRGVKQAHFFVLRETACPAALAEGLFVTNPDEAALLRSPAVQRAAGEAIAAGILDYIGRVR